MVDRILKQVQTAIQMAGVMVGIGVKNAQERAALSLHQDPLTPGLTLPLTPPLTHNQHPDPRPRASLQIRQGMET